MALGSDNTVLLDNNNIKSVQFTSNLYVFDKWLIIF